MYAADNERATQSSFQALVDRSPRVVAPPGPAPSFQRNYGSVGFTPKKAVKKTSSAASRRAATIAPARSSRPSVGNTATGTVAPIATPAPPPMSIDDWLAQDTSFKSQTDQLAKAWADYQAQSLQSENQYRTGYTQDADRLGKARTLAGQELESDFAGRGLLGSGIYAKAYTDYQNDYNDRQKALETGLGDFLANLASQKQNYKSDQDLQSEKAKQDAINRRAANLGI